MRLTMHRAPSPRREAAAPAVRLRHPVRRSALLLAMAALPAALVVPLATPAQAAPVTVTFNAGADQPFNVPSGVTQLTITATGAAGQSGVRGGTGGNGSTVTGTVTVPSGATTLYVNVATGGGMGAGNPNEAGGGGGASDVRTCHSTLPSCVLTGSPATDPRLIVAGGGGGGGSISPISPIILTEAFGGDAGNTGQAGGSRPTGGGGGGGATQTTPGTGGPACSAMAGPGAPGGAGTGGNGGSVGFPGGGGGAGWFGGGGGGGCDGVTSDGLGTGGGGGGSNRVPAGGTSRLATDLAMVTITYEQGGGNNGGGGGSILPVNLSGILPMYNNISINNNIKSPGAGNTSTQNFGLDAP
ncbi:hypothetical protein ACFCYI_00695 [Streptomyces sp. NPDC056257]|uniref:hypothetical protein n=1 Tax=Streptomyces sp. NPDC056257 TaxID=3345765 RepID=UPI0035E0EB6C